MLHRRWVYAGAVRAVVVGALVVAACGGSESPPDDGCPGPQPALADCFAGNFFADCGGDGEPRLACSDTEGCMWFSGGCVAAGFEASSCPADDICCHDDWPYPDPGSDYVVLARWFYTLGTAPWDRTTSTTLSVSIDPSLVVADSDITCDGPDLGLELRNPCSDPEGYGSFFLTPDTLLVESSHTSGIVGWSAQIEVVPDGGSLS